MASMARRSPPLTWAAQSFRGHGRHPKSGSQAGYAFAYKATCHRELAQLAVNPWLPSSHVATLERETLHPIGAKDRRGTGHVGAALARGLNARAAYCFRLLTSFASRAKSTR